MFWSISVGELGKSACFHRKQSNCPCVPPGSLVSFLYNLCILFYSSWIFLFGDLVSNWFFSAWPWNSFFVQMIRNSAHLFFYPVLTHSVMVLVYQHLPVFTYLSIAKLFFILFIVVMHSCYKHFKHYRRLLNLDCSASLDLNLILGTCTEFFQFFFIYYYF